MSHLSITLLGSADSLVAIASAGQVSTGTSAKPLIGSKSTLVYRKKLFEEVIGFAAMM